MTGTHPIFSDSLRRIRRIQDELGDLLRVHQQMAVDLILDEIKQARSAAVPRAYAGYVPQEECFSYEDWLGRNDCQ